MRAFRGLSALWPIIILAAAVSLAIPAAAATITVDTATDPPLATSDPGNCTLREAVEAANSNAAYDGCSAGAAGADTIQFGGNFTITFTQGEMPINEETTISGGAFTITLQGNGTERAFVLNGSGSNLHLEDLTIQDFVLTAGSGGAILLNSADAQLSATNVTFDGNQAADSTANGGAIYSQGNTALTNVIFTNNSAGNDGGAIFISGSALSIIDALFGTPPIVGTGNTAGTSGGAIKVLATSDLEPVSIVTSVFFDNEANGDSGTNAEYGGGAIWAQTSGTVAYMFLLSETQFISNRATAGAGGAILAANGSMIGFNDPSLIWTLPLTQGGIYRSNFELNEAQGTDAVVGSGGAIYNRGIMSIVSSSFIDNTSTHGAGGAIAHNPGSDRALTLANVTFEGNGADTNGGAVGSLGVTQGIVRLTNCTIAGNTANQTGSTDGGGGVYNNSNSLSDFLVENTIIANNTAGGSPENCAGDPVTDVGNNLQWPAATGCGTMTAANPLLDAAAPDLISLNPLVYVMPLQSLSAAAGGGNQTTCTAAPILSLDARASTRPDNHPNCDIGAYESDVVPVELMGLTID